MATTLIGTDFVHGSTATERLAAVAAERRKSLLFRLWIATGIFFMVLPGTILGFTNLLLISAHHGLGGLSPAWIQAHGHSQVFGWIGSFVLGIGFYSQPLTRANRGRLPVVCWSLWAAGLTLHWLAGAYLWQWRVTLPLSGVLELAAILLFLYAASQHKLPEHAGEKLAPKAKPRIEPWMQTVLVSNAALFLAIAINFAIEVRLALAGLTPARPHGFDQRYLVLLGWGFLAPLVWGFSARWLPIFLGVKPVRGRMMQIRRRGRSRRGRPWHGGADPAGDIACSPLPRYLPRLPCACSPYLNGRRRPSESTPAFQYFCAWLTCGLFLPRCSAFGLP